MAFKFNFSHNTSDQEKYDYHIADASDSPSCRDGKETSCLAAQEVIPSSLQESGDLHSVEYKICDWSLRVVRQQSHQAISSTLSSVTSNSDLVPGVYEGGLKIWECGVDLAEFLIKENIDVKGLSILELGCGAGLPGITAVHRGAASVHFQDYNPEVIEDITIPNVQMNKCFDCKCRYFSGDWSSLPLVISPSGEENRYDMILTAETIYNTDSYSKLHQVFDKLIKNNGIIYLAAKSTYFGVGGGTRLFEDFLNRQKLFTSEVCLEIPAGIPREILKITRRKT